MSEIPVELLDDWALGLLASLIVSVLGALLTYGLRRNDEKRDSRIAELRVEVFGPMLRVSGS